MAVKSVVVYSPEEVSKRLGGISVTQIVAILKAHGYDYTQLTPGSKPWGRGRQVWGMTDDQIAAVVRGQTKRHPPPTEAGQGGEPGGVKPAAHPPWDRRSRLRPRRRRPDES